MIQDATISSIVMCWKQTNETSEVNKTPPESLINNKDSHFQRWKLLQFSQPLFCFLSPVLSDKCEHASIYILSFILVVQSFFSPKFKQAITLRGLCQLIIAVIFKLWSSYLQVLKQLVFSSSVPVAFISSMITSYKMTHEVIIRQCMSWSLWNKRDKRFPLWLWLWIFNNIKYS